MTSYLMKRIAMMWVLPVLTLSGLTTWGQETDSLFFRSESRPTRFPDSETSAPSSVTRQWVAAEPFMNNRVHVTADFIRRLNEQLASDQDAPGGPSARAWRLRALFNNEDARLVRRPTNATGGYPELVDAFIDDVCQETTDQRLVDANEQLYAEVLASVTWQQRELALTLYLQKKRSGANWSWEITGADVPFPLPDADTSYLQPSPQDSLVFIPPNAHELNFMGLAKQLRSGITLGTFVSPAARHDACLAALARQAATGQLRWQALLTTTVWLHRPLNWVLQLRYFNRETDQSGWLISDLCRLGEGVCLPPVLRRFIKDTYAVTKP